MRPDSSQSIPIVRLPGLLPRVPGPGEDARGEAEAGTTVIRRDCWPGLTRRLSGRIGLEKVPLKREDALEPSKETARCAKSKAGESLELLPSRPRIRARLRREAIRVGLEVPIVGVDEEVEPNRNQEGADNHDRQGSPHRRSWVRRLGK